MIYIIALLAQCPNFFIQEAQRQFANNYKTYLLSENSLPHITLAQFNLEDQILLPKIWKELNNKIVFIAQPKFIGLNLSKKSKNLWGISLTVERSVELVNMQNVVVSILEQFNLKCLNHTGDLYRPHLTLARIEKPKIENFDDTLLNESTFILAIGQGDKEGQFMQINYKTH